MANPNQVAGQARVKIDGTQYSTAGETTLDIGGITREPVPGDFEAGGFKEMTAPAKLEATLLYKGGLGISGLRAINNATVTIEFDTGQTWIVRNGYCADAISISQDGKVKVTFGGPPAEELL